MKHPCRTFLAMSAFAASALAAPVFRTDTIEAPDGHPDAPRVNLTPIGQMVEHELLTAIHARYPMAEIQDHVVMPDHLHFLLRVKGRLVSTLGKSVPLGQVIAGFKKGCNRRFWEMTGNSGGQTTAHTTAPASVVGGLPAATPAPSAEPAPEASAEPAAEAEKAEEPAAEETAAEPAAEAQSFTVGICQLVQHPALDAATQGFKDALTAKLGDAVTFSEQNASGDSATCAVICNQFVSDEVNLILANATPALLAAQSATNKIPILGTSVTDYASALAIDNWTGATGTNISGTSDGVPAQAQAELLQQVFPDAKNVGLLYCSGEPNSKFQAD